MITRDRYAPQLREFLYISLCVLPVSICTVLLLFLPKFNVPITVWRDYFILLVDAEAEPEPVIDSLRAFGIDHVSDRNTRVFLNTFSGKEEVPLASLQQRLDPADPRYDPYMSALPGYFKAGYRADRWHVMYVKAGATQTGLVRSLSRCLSPLGIEYRLPEWRPFWFFLGPVAACSFFFALVRDRRRALKLLIIAVPLFALSTKASGLGLAASFVLMPGWLYLADALRRLLTGYFYNREFMPERRVVLTGLGLFAAGIVCAYGLSVFHVDALRFRGTLSFTVVALIASAGTMSGWLVFRAGASFHRVFYGTPLLQGTGFQTRKELDQTNAMLRSLLVAVVVFTPALVTLSRIDSSLSVAEPAGGYKRSVVKIETLADSAVSATEYTLPNLTDYVTHRAYQDLLLYGRQWNYPVPGGAVTVRSYRDEGGRVVSGERRVLSFDSQWFEGVIADAAIDGVGGMLLAQGGGVTVSRRSGDRRIGRTMLKSLGVAALLVIPLVYLLPGLTTYYFYGIRNLPLRRKRQTA